jgi:hypothetical protein
VRRASGVRRPGRARSPGPCPCPTRARSPGQPVRDRPGPFARARSPGPCPCAIARARCLDRAHSPVPVRVWNLSMFRLSGEGLLGWPSTALSGRLEHIAGAIRPGKGPFSLPAPPSGPPSGQLEHRDVLPTGRGPSQALASRGLTGARTHHRGAIRRGMASVAVGGGSPATLAIRARPHFSIASEKPRRKPDPCRSMSS